MAQIPSGFTFNDDITEDASERFPPPALGSTSINWNDAGSVYDAIQQVSEQFKQAFADLIDQSAKGTDNSVESRLFFTIAAYSAMNELHDMTAPHTLQHAHEPASRLGAGHQRLRKQRGTDGSLAGRENRA